MFLTVGLLVALSGNSDIYCRQSTQQHCQLSPLAHVETYQLKHYKQWTWLSAFEPSGLHWDQFVSVYINRDSQVYQNNHAAYLAEFMDEYDESEIAYKSYPIDTVLVKENYAPRDGKPSALTSLTVMIKAFTDREDKAMNWRYQQYSASGQLLLDGQADNPAIKATCASCHNNVSERDFVFSTQLSTQFKHR